MHPSVVLFVVLALVLLIVYWQRSRLGAWHNLVLGAAVAPVIVVGAWCAVEWATPRPTPSEDSAELTPVVSETCAQCHQSQYESWRRTFHRTMTREATPENVKAVFDGAEQIHAGVTSRMVREGDQYYMDTVDPEWLAEVARRGIPLEKAGPAPRRKISVDRLVGSHWFQQMLHRDDEGRYVRLPLAYHIVEKRWIHIDGVFLGPDSDHFFSKVNIWNETCLYCHNTRPVKNPVSIPGSQTGYSTEVGELGISCEACHGSGARHVLAHQKNGSDSSIVHPAHLSVERSDEICAKCHGGTMPRYENWDQRTFAEPYLAGKELHRFWHTPFSEAEQHLISGGRQAEANRKMKPEPLDGRFWGDGTPLTTALEYQGLSLSACYKEGHGELRCITCHSMHGGDTNHQLRDGMRTNAACFSCHEKYRAKLSEHTHHPADSPGSLCMNCHMPHQVYSLLSTHRSHRIDVPRVRDSLGTGKPHACNLCHLDKSLGWTQDNLGKWFGTKPEPLSEEDRTIASSVLHLTSGDARSRAVVAGAFGWTPAQQASGRDWSAPLLLRALENERFQAVRYNTHVALRSMNSAAAKYDYQGSHSIRTEQLRAMRLAFDKTARPDPARYPYIPFDVSGRFDDAVFDRLLKKRTDPDVSVNE